MSSEGVGLEGMTKKRWFRICANESFDFTMRPLVKLAGNREF